MAATTVGEERELVERSGQLSLLSEALARVDATAQGRLVLVRGEAGVGKTVLVRQFCEQETRAARVLWGSCDALFTPRPLGPLLDIALLTGGSLEELVTSGAKPHEVATALTRELERRPLTVVVLDDVHWADEATLDVLRLLARRLESLPALVVATFRDDELDRGLWAEAGESAQIALPDPRTWSVPRIAALAVVGLLRARRGDPEVWEPLDEALALAEPTGEPQRVGPVAAARAEAAWLAGELEAIGPATGEALALAGQLGAPWVVGELAAWRRRAGIEEPVPEGVAEPYARQFRGDWAGAVELWNELGCPYEAALAGFDADDEGTLARSFAELQRLGAPPAAAIVARRLRSLGVRQFPRGPRPATQANPAQLTRRELEVLGLLTEGLQDAEIAGRLFLSERTVHSHVSAILRKLDVRTRGQAAVAAAKLGVG